MKNASARTTYLKDYSPPPFTIVTTDLSFDLYEDHASVVSKLLFTRSTHEGAANATSLELQGQLLTLERLAINGQPLAPDQYLVDDESLTIPELDVLLGAGFSEFASNAILE